MLGACQLLNKGPSGAECRLPEAFSGSHNDVVYWKEVFKKALSFDGVQKDLIDEEEKVSKLNRKLRDARSALFPTAIFSIFGTLLFLWLLGNRDSSEKSSGGKKI